jgi:hypothetical protein
MPGREAGKDLAGLTLLASRRVEAMKPNGLAAGPESDNQVALSGNRQVNGEVRKRPLVLELDTNDRARRWQPGEKTRDKPREGADGVQRDTSGFSASQR